MSRPRKPTSLKLVQGTARVGRENAAEPEPPLLNDLEPPPHLSERSADVWRELAPLLRQALVLTVVDRVELEMLCDQVADYRYARQQRGDKFVGFSPKTGAQMLNQWHVAQTMACKRVDELGARFGMNPAARSRLTVTAQGDLFGDDKPAAAGTSRFFKA